MAGTGRSLVVVQNITLDGVIEMVDGWFDPADDAGGDNDDIVEELREQMAAEDALLLGRSTYEDFRGYWPGRTDDTTGVAAHLHEVRKYVVSSSQLDPGWHNATVLTGSLTENVLALRRGPGRDICVTGSISVTHQLIAAGLVDEYRLFVYPVVVGHGRRLFPPGTALPPLRLVSSRAFRSGVVLLGYRTGPREG
ncbi:dihydrofolate reductase family protein [Streptomyces lonarensis]|uniref:Dihydrofolate reductase n=1 Tax=Streptomyces lonarensis TaxID=700599 RepID=A0A7X6D3Y8_9ACTN|nr:dihydrofolate reductase family protein [Streptomyces lonarensis]NJQ07645.1 dihydrofolate reductase [Streptomyces lonarensis]